MADPNQTLLLLSFFTTFLLLFKAFDSGQFVLVPFFSSTEMVDAVVQATFSIVMTSSFSFDAVHIACLHHFRLLDMVTALDHDLGYWINHVLQCDFPAFC